MLFVYSSYLFPLDYLIFFIFTLYIFICTLYGVVRVGLNCFKVFLSFIIIIYNNQTLEIKKESTPPSLLFIIAIILNISILVVCNQLMTLCPQYATFGNQHFFDRKTRNLELCTLEAYSKVEAKFTCQMTTLSSFYNKYF